MEMRVNHDLVKQLRLERSWSQEKLADQADVSLRTIQRIETNGVTSLKSRLSVAEALEIDPTDLDVWGEEFPSHESSLQQLVNGNSDQEQPNPKPISIWLRIPVMTFIWIGVLIPVGMSLVLLLATVVNESLGVMEFWTFFGKVLLASMPVAVILGIFTPIYWQLQKLARNSRE